MFKINIMSPQEIIQNQMLQLKERETDRQKNSVKYQRYWKICQLLIGITGILTPLIVIYRKDSFFPQEFWVMWCTAMPVITTLASFAITYFDWQGLSNVYAKDASLTRNLIERAESKFMMISEGDYVGFHDWLIGEKQRIDEVL